MEVLSSRTLLRPRSFERTFRFYTERLGLHVYREWGSGRTRGVVFFLGGGSSRSRDRVKNRPARRCSCGSRCAT